MNEEKEGLLAMGARWMGVLLGGFCLGGDGSEEGRERVASGEFGVFLHGGCELRPHLSAAGQPVPTPGPQRPTSRNLLYASRITTQLLRGFKIWPKQSFFL